MSSKKTGKNKQRRQSLCNNPAGCYRPANGTDGWGRCMHCEDDSGNNQPMNAKLRKQYEPEWTPAGYIWKHKETGKYFGTSPRAQR